MEELGVDGGSVWMEKKERVRDRGGWGKRGEGGGGRGGGGGGGEKGGRV
jgi:hypothetical protein